MSEHVLSYRPVDSVTDPEGTLTLVVYLVDCSCGWCSGRVAGTRGAAEAGRQHVETHDD